MAEGVRTRAKVVRAGLIGGLAAVISVLVMTALHWESVQAAFVLRQAGACVVSGFLSALLVLLILPLFESAFHITTNITLLELSDLGHPLLQRLAIEAPGTYHHSLVVANLAQAAADEIGANALLTRVGAYFHDIGKLTKPGFFAENLQHQRNPHDELPPSMSTLVITAHVKEGLSLAMLHKLPECVMNIISEHHGNSLLACFHRKAQTQLETELAETEPAGGGANAQLDESDFRYSGPRPGTRESAIISLADAVEAASRSMEKKTPGHIEGLIDDIVNARVRDGQLSRCELTMLELDRIKRSFIFTLTNMHHGRVAYPDDENRDKQPPRAAQGTQGENQGADGVADAKGSRPRRQRKLA
jgi:putative nucleotidyltransferase with HDIG domain